MQVAQIQHLVRELDPTCHKKKSCMLQWRWKITACRNSKPVQPNKQIFFLRTSLVIQWLRLRVSNVGSVGLIPGQGTKITHAIWHSQKIFKLEKKKIFFKKWDGMFCCCLFLMPLLSAMAVTASCPSSLWALLTLWWWKEEGRGTHTKHF